jgi:hypothetical protein
MQNARSKADVQISTSGTPTSKEPHEKSIYLFLDLLPKNHGFLGHLSFSHEIERTDPCTFLVRSLSYQTVPEFSAVD